MNSARILIIDDEEKIRKLLAQTLTYEGYEVHTVANISSALSFLQDHAIEVVLSDVKLPDGNGVDLTKSIKETYPGTEVIVLTAFGRIHDGVRAMQHGAFDYLVKGDDNEKIIPLVSQAAEKAQLQRKVQQLEARIDRKYGFERIIGTSIAIRQAVDLARKVAATNTSVLLTGETGTGKEVFARAIHYSGARKNHSFVAVNCSAFGRDLLESEMFGHRAGAFTGATRDKKGLFEEANKGTIFLDEIGEMDLDLQAKLLRVLEEGSFIKVGETQETLVNVRVIAATNRDLEDEAEKGNFRLDLFYRLAIFQIPLPSLNQRTEDIPMLTEFFAQSLSTRMGKKVETISPDFIRALQQHHWKGNIRELRNTIERCLILTDDSQLTADLLPQDFAHTNQTKISLPTTPTATGSFSLEQAERARIREALEHTNGNKTQAAKLLGIGLTTLYRKLEEYGW